MIREAVEFDLFQIAKLGEEYADEVQTHQDFPYHMPTAIANFSLAIESPYFCTFVGVKGTEIVGFLWGYVTSLPWSLTPIAFDNILYVKPEHRGTSIGVKLILAYEKWARDRDIKIACLSIASGITEERTGKLYEKLGYVKVGIQYRKQLNG